MYSNSVLNFQESTTMLNAHTKRFWKLIVCTSCVLKTSANLLNTSANVLNSSSSSYRTISTDIPDPRSPPIPIVHCFCQVFRATSRIGTELLYVGSSWSSCLCSSMWRGPQEYITYELVSTSPAASCMSGLSNFDSFRDGWLVAVQLLLHGVLPPGLVQCWSQHFCAVAVKLFLHTFS